MKNADPVLPRTRIVGLDAIRIVLALVVAFSHGFGVHFQQVLDKPTMLATPLGTLAWVLAGNLYNGQAAVIVFFIISGFCIHYPYAAGRRPETVGFLSRRYIRIGLPLAACLSVGSFCFDIEPLAYVGIWSLLCEIVYYTLYPLLHRVRARLASWMPLYAAALLIAGGTLLLSRKPLASEPGRLMDFPAYGTLVTAVIGLPIWLLGCHLAETDWSSVRACASRNRIWRYRSAILFASIALSVLKFHGHRIWGRDLPYYLSLHLFAVPAFFWVRQEIAGYRDGPVSRMLEWGGKWSYSLYIFHPLALAALPVSRLGPRLAAMSHLAGAALELTILLAGAYLFYAAVERPSHLLARMASRSA